MNPILVAQNIKDTNFWKQFTTIMILMRKRRGLLRISKIQTFESNSQPNLIPYLLFVGCSEYQRYKLLKAIHNYRMCLPVERLLLRISKIQTFESNSQLCSTAASIARCCSEYQRYKLLKAIHNKGFSVHIWFPVAQNIKDTNFWKQFTTLSSNILMASALLRISKIQTFESNSQPIWDWKDKKDCCSEYQRYKLLKAIHNTTPPFVAMPMVAQNIKDTNFWKQFTTVFPFIMFLF